MPWRGPRVPGEFPTLGYQVIDWIEANVVVPDRESAGQPLRLSERQQMFLLHFYRLDPEMGLFTYRRGGSLVAPQKWGKSPFGAAICLAEALGPVVPDGWDGDGEPVGRPWPTPIIQVTAVSEGQTANVWDALVPMVQLGDLAAEVPDTGVTRINLPGGGHIRPVTAAHRSRLGQRITFCLQDQTESWLESNHGRALADAQRRNLAGTGGRFLETPNAWDVHEGSVAQQGWESGEPGVYRWMADAGPGSVGDRRERRRMLRRVYDGHLVEQGGWVDLDRVEAEVEALLLRDRGQAERWFLNRLVAGSDAAFDMDQWARAARPGYRPEPGALVAVGVDGARWDDSLAVVATEVESGYQWVAGLWETPEHPPDDYQHDLEEADAVMRGLFDEFTVTRVYVDPQRIEALLERWQGRWGAKRVFEWLTTRERQICWAVRAYTEALGAGDITHDPDPRFEAHVRNARKQLRAVYDDDRRRMWTLAKDAPMSPRKIDAAMAAVLSWEARGDSVAAGDTENPVSVYESRGFAFL